MAKIKVGFDAGHGGVDPGATNGKRLEKHDALRLEKAVSAYLLKHSNNIEVYHTRTGDSSLSLGQRSGYLNSKGVKIAVSFHRDSGVNSASGATVRVQKGCINSDAGRLAKNIAKRLIKVNKGNRADADGVVEQNLHMTRETNMPACLIECGFISNGNDNKIFDTKFNDLVEAIGDGILEYLGLKKQNIAPSAPIQPKPPVSTQGFYRIRKSWGDAKSQIGAYSDKENAIAECKKHKGYNVYDNNGGLVYSNSAPTASKPVGKANIKKIQSLCNRVLGSKLTVDGVWGVNTDAQVKKLKLCGYAYVNSECTTFVQEVLGVGVDGIFGRGTESKVKTFQKSKGLPADGVVGYNTYKALANK